MKSFFFFSFLFLGGVAFAQNQEIASADIYTIHSKHFNTDSIQNDGHPIILSFWATWCKPCIKELNNIAEVYEEWREETKVKLVAISIDDSRNLQKLAPMLESLDWPYEVYSDQNSDFRRAMNVNTVPHTFLIDQNRNVVWQHQGYTEGAEDILYEQLLNLIDQ